MHVCPHQGQADIVVSCLSFRWYHSTGLMSGKLRSQAVEHKWSQSQGLVVPGQRGQKVWWIGHSVGHNTFPTRSWITKEMNVLKQSGNILKWTFTISPCPPEIFFFSQREKECTSFFFPFPVNVIEEMFQIGAFSARIYLVCVHACVHVEFSLGKKNRQ